MRFDMGSSTLVSGSATTGAGAAVKAYAEGDREMAARAQADASSVSEPDMPGGR